jgi:hypothetical protein
MDRLLSSPKSLVPESMAFWAFATSHLRTPFVFYSRIFTPLAPVRFRGVYARPVFCPTTPVIVSAATKGGGCGGNGRTQRALRTYALIGWFMILLAYEGVRARDGEADAVLI